MDTEKMDKFAEYMSQEIRKYHEENKIEFCEIGIILGHLMISSLQSFDIPKYEILKFIDYTYDTYFDAIKIEMCKNFKEE